MGLSASCGQLALYRQVVEVTVVGVTAGTDGHESSCGLCGVGVCYLGALFSRVSIYSVQIPSSNQHLAWRMPEHHKIMAPRVTDKAFGGGRGDTTGLCGLGAL